MAAFVNPQQNLNGAPMAIPGQSPNQTSPNQPPTAVQQIYGMMANQGVPARAGMAGAAANQASSNTTGSSTFGSNTGMNTTLGGMFAGVASIAQGTGIKIINDQHEYAKWEFWFNPQQYTTGGTANPQGSTSGTGSPGQNGALNQQNGFGFGTGSTLSSQGAGQGMTGGVFSNNATPAAPSNSQPQQ
jgi:hypothetical protein